MATTPKFRWIIYLHHPLGSFDVQRVTSLEAAKDALRDYDRNTGVNQALQAGSGEYGCSGSLYPYTEKAWEEAEEFGTSGCPFGYPSWLVKNGPRGGVYLECPI